MAEDDGVPRCAPLPEPQFGALREGGGTREAGSTVAESLVVLYYRVGTHQIRRRRRAARSLTSQGRAEPLCARITGLNREVSAAAVWLAEDDGVPRCAPLPEPQFGALREGGGTREAGSTVAESLVVLYYRVGTHQIRRRRRAARSLTSQGRAEPLCARITGLNREVSEGKADL